MRGVRWGEFVVACFAALVFAWLCGDGDTFAWFCFGYFGLDFLLRGRL